MEQSFIPQLANAGHKRYYKIAPILNVTPRIDIIMKPSLYALTWGLTYWVIQ